MNTKQWRQKNLGRRTDDVIAELALGTDEMSRLFSLQLEMQQRELAYLYRGYFRLTVWLAVMSAATAAFVVTLVYILCT